MTARQDILDAARALRAVGREPFSPADLAAELRRRGSTYPESTLRTHIASVMCVNAPEHHAVRYADLERVGQRRYRLAATAGAAPVTASARTGRRSERAARCDTDLQRWIIGAIEERGGRSPLPLGDLAGEADVEWQLEDLVRRGYVKEDDGSAVLTRAGERAAVHGFPTEPAGRTSPLAPHELELLHQLMWDAADEVAGDERRRFTTGVKWMLEEYFGINTTDRGGPHGKARRDAFRRLEAIGAIEQIGGGEAQRTSNCWVTDPGQVQYPW
ncbi:MAG TPA: hypothetical protein VHF25_08820 [Nitriliruptorales bacterium]|nr:hypothetical protein [Nitriliruptorales bacterium]